MGESFRDQDSMWRTTDSRRGGVLGAMETMYQRGKIQDESMYYEHLKHDGTLPIIGVNTFQNPNAQVFDESAADDSDLAKKVLSYITLRSIKERKSEDVKVLRCPCSH